MPEPKAMPALVTIIGDAFHGEISIREALKRASQPAAYNSLSDELAVQLSREALNRVSEEMENWAGSVLMHSLLWACFDARSKATRPATPAVLEMTWNWINLSTAALWHVPDPSIYKSALARGELALAAVRSAGNKTAIADFAHALGTLHLDPYAAVRSVHGRDQQLRAWEERARNGETWNQERYFDSNQDGYPLPVIEALEKAKAYYTEAVASSTGSQRAKALKALAQTLHAYHLFDLPADLPAIAAAAREALTLIDALQSPDIASELTNYLRFADENAEVSPVPDSWLNSSLDASIAAHGERRTKHAVINSASGLLSSDPARAVRLLLDAAPLFKEYDPENEPSDYHMLLLRAFARGHGFRAKDFMSDPLPTDSLVRNMLGKAGEEDWDPARVAGLLVAIAEYSISRDEETLGLRALATMEAVAPITAAPLADSLNHFRGQLLLNDGVNAVNRQDWDGAVNRYSMALALANQNRDPRLIAELLNRLGDVVQHGGPATASYVVDILRDHTDSIEMIGGEWAIQLLQEIYRLAALIVVNQDGATDVLWNLVQLAKGRRFAAMIAAGSAQRITDEDRNPAALEQLRVAREEVEAEESGETAGERLTEEILVSPYSRESIQLAGDSAMERLTNLEHRYDVELFDLMAAKSAGISGLLASDAAVREALDENTVLLQYFFPRSNQSPATLLVALTTREETQWSQVRVLGDPSVHMQMVIDGVALDTSAQSVIVSTLRKALIEDEGTIELSEPARRAVARASELLINPLKTRLSDLHQAGKTHLCIAPHGPLAFAPFHLLGNYPQTLADDWAVTYLMNSQLLSTHQGGASLRRHRVQTLAAFGLSFIDDESGYEPIPEAVREAQSVAKAVGGVAIVEQDATKRALKEALVNARYVHIATHGRQQPWAPSFHTFRLTPELGDDGDFFAHELLGMDLRGLELITLSACDTALGRFDNGDNPHGMPAMLLLAGVRTIVGTLWGVDSGCSEYFFTGLYREIGKGKSKLTAFQNTLAATRKYFPRFQDWGGFYFSGDWR